MTALPYVVVLKQPGSKTPVHFHCVARSEAEALRIARRLHPRWHQIETTKEKV